MKKIRKYITKSSQQTKKMGERIAKEVLQASDTCKSAVVLGLQGELGAGKTTFLQGFARGLGIKEKVLSPTFILMKKFQIPIYAIPENRRSSILWYRYFYHIDCYRIKNVKEILDLGFNEIIYNSENIVAIEWPEKIKKILPKDTVLIQFKHNKENSRTLTFKEKYSKLLTSS